MATAQATHHGVLRLCFVFVLACAPGFAARAAAQSVPPENSSFAALQSRVTAGDTVSVRLTSGEEVAGTLVRASAVSLTLMAAGEPREFQANEVQQVVRDRGANRLGRGLLFGITIGALAGAPGCYRVDTSGYRPGTDAPLPCGASVAAGMAIGGSLGALIGSRVTRPTVVYSAVAAPPVPSALEGISAPVPVAPRPADAARPPSARTGPVASLSSLSTRVIPFQTIYVRTRTGEEVAGTFSAASDERLRMDVGGRTWEIAATDVHEVRLRGGRQVKQGALTGLAGGAVILGAAFGAGAAAKDDPAVAAEGDSVGAAVLFGAVVGGAVGVMWGSIIGALIHERPLVYTSATPSVRVTPRVAPRQVGVLASVRF